MEEWQLREAHENGLRKLLKELGWMDKDGCIRKFDGRVFWPKWNAMGHSTTAYNTCSCRN